MGTNKSEIVGSATENFVVTTAHKASIAMKEDAIKIAKELGTVFIPRRKFREYIRTHVVDFYYVAEEKRLVIRRDRTILFFHPSLAKVRRKNIRMGQRDYLLEALKLQGSERILDGTLGLASEAILIASNLNDKGSIVGLEGSKHIYMIMKWGMERYESEKWIIDALKRISIRNTLFSRYARSQPSDSFDIVYLDPMFEHPNMASSSMNPLRAFAVYDNLTSRDVEEAKRIARKRVVIKSRIEDSLFKRIQVDKIMGSRKSGVLYGLIEV